MFCISCLFPNTKPDIDFDSNGICDSCVSAKKSGLYKSINWEQREKFKEILEYSKQYSNSYYNCVVP